MAIKDWDELTPAQKGAVVALKSAGGSGILNNKGMLAVTAGGQRLAYEAMTFLRLVTYGYVMPDGHNRLKLTLGAVGVLAKQDIQV